MSKPISESSSLKISVPMLIQAIGFIGAMVYGYGQLNTRLQFVEHQAEMNDKTIAKILAVTAIVIGSYYQTTSKMADMERTIMEMHSEIIILNSKMAKIETEKVEDLEEENRSLLQRMGLKRP